MSEQGHSVAVNLLGKEHHIACPQGQEQALLDAVDLLNKSVEQMRQRSAIRNDDKALLMAALNLSHELLALEAKLQAQEQSNLSLCAKIESQLD